MLGIFRAKPGGGGRSCRSTRKASAARSKFCPAPRTAPRTAISSRSDLTQHNAPTAFRRRACARRLGSIKSERAVSLIAIHAHGIPDAFSREARRRGGGRASPRARRAARTGATCRSSPSTAPTPRPRRRGLRRARSATRTTPAARSSAVAIADVAALRAARRRARPRGAERGNSVYFPDRVVPMLPERSRTTCARCGRTRTAPALAVRMSIDADGQQARHRFHARPDALGRAAHLRAGAGGDRRHPDETTGPLLEPCSSRSTAPIARCSSARDAARRRSSSTCPSARSC